MILNCDKLFYSLANSTLGYSLDVLTLVLCAFYTFLNI